jgi:hypothetical protein
MLSRFTDPGEQAPQLDVVPQDPREICVLASRQTIHHNLLPSLGVPREAWPALRRVWPPRLEHILGALQELPPHTLTASRRPENRLVGGCMLEAHFLAGLLRHRGFEVRIRAGYFANVRADRRRIVRFWEDVLREKRVQPELLERDPEQWRRVMNAYTERKNELDHRIEHWICEYRGAGEREWTLLDANDDFLRYHSGLTVGFRLPRRHFEHAHEAWLRLRADRTIDPARYAEEPQDGRSHVPSQLLWDFFSLLNHDLAAVEEPEGADYAFLKRRSFEELRDDELEALDSLAALLSLEPSAEQLVAFYRATPVLRMRSADRDPYNLVSAG